VVGPAQRFASNCCLRRWMLNVTCFPLKVTVKVECASNMHFRDGYIFTFSIYQCILWYCMYILHHAGNRSNMFLAVHVLQVPVQW
jgi:hypothetical protein